MANALKTKKELVQELEEALKRISEAERLRKALRESEENFSRIFSHNPLALSISRVRDGVIIEINESYTRFAGYKREEIIGRMASEMNIWVNLPDRERMLKSLKDKGQIISEEYYFRSKSGEVHPVLLSAENINIGGEDCLLIMTIDISRRVSTEEELRESEEFTSSLLEKTPDPIIVITPDTAIKYVNPAFEKLTGFTLTDIIGTKTPYPWWLEETKEKIDAALKQAVFEDVKKMEMAYQKKSGEHFWVELNATSIKKDGEQKYTLVNWVDITERKKAEKALRESEQKYSGLVEHGNDGILIIQDRVIKYVNSKLLDIFGYPYEEVVGKQFASVIAEEHRERVIQRSRKRLAGEEVPEKYEFDIINKKGEKVSLEVNASLMEFEGRPADMAIVRDITERKNAEKAVHESEEKFSKAFNASATAICIISLSDGKFVEINEGYTRFTGYTREEAIGYTAAELNLWINPEEFKQVQINENKGNFTNLEFHSRMKSGEIRVGLSSSEKIIIGGKECRIVAITDITERKQVEEARRALEKRYQSYIEVAGGIGWVTNANGEVTEDVPSFRKFTGQSYEEIKGLGWSKTVHPDDLEPTMQVWFKAVQEKSNYETEYRLRRYDGEYRYFLARGVPALKQDGSIREWIGTCIDITERKRAEEALRESEEKFSKAFSSSGNAICITSLLDNKFLDINEAYSRFTGYSREEAIGHTAAELKLWVNPEELEKMQAILTKEGKFNDLEFHSRMKSGEIRVGLSSARLITIGGKDCRIVVITDITERKKTEEAFRESEEKFKILFEYAPDAYYLNDLKGNLIDGNKNAEGITGYKRDELIGKSFLKLGLLSPRQIPKAAALLAKNVLGRPTGPDEFVLIRKDGSQVPVEIKTFPIKVRGKTRVLGTARDITERKQLEQELQQSRNSLLEAQQIARVGSWDWDIITNIISYSDEFHRIFGQHIRNFEAFLDSLHPDDRELVEKSVKEALWANKPYDIEYRIILSNQEERIIYAQARVTFDNAGKPVRMIGTVQDITERKKAEEKIRESEEKFRSIVENSSDQIFMLDKYYKLLSINKTAADISRKSPQEMIGMSIFKIFPEDIAAKFSENIKNVFDTGESILFEEKMIVQGREFENSTSLNPVKDDKGSVIAVTGIVRDVTERKQAEEKIKQSMANLERSSARLAAANKELEAFSYSVSHDLRSPLRSIDGFSQALMEDYADKIDATGQDYLNRLRNASQKMGELIDGLLRLSRLSRSELHKEPVDLSTLAIEIATRLRETQPERKAEFIIGGDMTVNGDPQLLRALLENLLGNAWKFTNKVPSAIIEFGSISNGAQKTFFVKDNGAGFDMTYVDKLFGAFQRLHDVTEFPGTGIGLATVQRIVNRHGGTVRAEGELGKGATFYFTLG